MVKKAANWIQSDLTFGTLTLAFIWVSLYGDGGRITLQHMACDNNKMVKSLNITLNDAASFAV